MQKTYHILHIFITFLVLTCGSLKDNKPHPEARQKVSENVKPQLYIPKAEHTLDGIVLNPNQLTITSILYNPNSVYSEWVDRNFGSKSIFYAVDGSTFLDEHFLSPAEVVARTFNVSTVFKLPDYAIWPPCSLEMLGFVNIDSPHDHEFGEREKPFFGKGVVHLSKVGNSTPVESWECFYRPLFENWRSEHSFAKPHYWSVVFFCPASKLEASCSAMEDLTMNRTRFSLSVSIETKTKTWKTAFVAKVLNKETIAKSVRTLRMPLAVCATIPYTSSDPEKAKANTAMLVEWIRYHSKIGMKVILYDRDGANRDNIYNSSYAKTQGMGKLDFVYHDYTIRGLLDPSRKGVQYDNTEQNYANETEEISRKSRYETQGHDKTQTFTQCRFEAKALYGLDTVLIADFDEFFFCYHAEATAEAQRRFLKQFLEYHRRRGVDQLMFPQRLVLTKTNSPRDCLVDKVNKGKSIFDCLAPYEYYMGGHSVKSIHLGHKCPLTGYHQACPSAQVPRSYNCLCNNEVVRQNPWRLDKGGMEHLTGRECGLVHYSTRSEAYNHKRYKHKPEDVVKAKSETIELAKIVNS